MRYSLGLILTLTTLSTAHATPGETRRVVTQRALDVALSSANGQGCISCHVTGQVMAAVGAAEVSGFEPDRSQANRVLGYAWNQQTNRGSVIHAGTLYEIETSAWVAWALSYYGGETNLDVRTDPIRNLGNWLLDQRRDDGGLPPNDHDNGIISIPSRVMPTMSTARISQWLFNQTGEMRYRTGMADLGRYLAETAPGNWHGDSGLLEMCYELIGLAATGRSARDPKMAALRDALLARQQNDTCWSFSVGNSCDGFTTGLVGNALLDAGMPFGHPSIQNAVTWLIDNNNNSGWWPRQLFSNDVSVSTNPVIFLSRIPVFYISHLTPENGVTFADGEPQTVISTDGISEEGLNYELTLFIDNIPVARARNEGIEYRWNLRNVAPGQHRIRVVGMDAEGFADSRESVVLVGDFVGLLGTVTPNPFNADATNALAEYEVFGQEAAQITMNVHATKDDDQGVPRQAGLPCTQDNAAQVCVSEGSTCEVSAGELDMMRCSDDSVHRVLVSGDINPGMHVQSFDGRDEAGNRLPDGVYLLHFTARRGENEQTGSVLVGVLSDEPAEIRGVVKDRDTDRGIPGARVILQTPRGGRMQAGEVGLTGSYVLPLIRPGAYRVVAEVPGYPEPEPVAVELGAGQRERLDFWLTGNQPPFFAPVDPLEPLSEGQTFTLYVRAYDMQNDPISLSATPPMGGRFRDLGNGIGRFVWTVPFGTQRSTSLLLEATDGQGLTELLIPLPIAQSNRPPVIAGLDAASLRAGQIFERHVHAADPDGDSVTLRAEGLPPGASFDGVTLRYTPPVALLARFDVRFTATDDGAPSAETIGVLSISVGPPNSPPVLRPVERLIIPVVAPFEHRFEAIDPDGDSVHFMTQTLPDGLTLSRDGVLTGQVVAELADTRSVMTLVASDDHQPAGVARLQIKLVFVASDNTPFIELPERIEVTPGSVWRHRVVYGAPHGREHLSLRIMMGPVGMDLLGDGETLRWAVPHDFHGQTPLRLRLVGADPPVSADAVIASGEANLPPVIKIKTKPRFDAAGAATIDASASFDPEEAQLVFEWNPAEGLAIVTDDGTGTITVLRERADANKVVLVVSDGTHRVSKTLKIGEATDGLTPDSCHNSGGAAGLVLLVCLLGLRRRRLLAGLVIMSVLQACSMMDVPPAPADPIPTLVPGLIELSIPDDRSMVRIVGDHGAAEPGAEVSVTALGEPVTTEADSTGAFTLALVASDGDALTARQQFDGQTSSAVTLSVPVRAPQGMAWLESDGMGGDELVIRPQLIGEASARIELPTGWVTLPAPDSDGRLAVSIAADSVQAGDPITIEQTVQGKPSLSGTLHLMDAGSDRSVAVTPSPTDSNVLWVSGPPTQGRDGAFILVTNLMVDGLPQGRTRAHADGSFGPLKMPGSHGDRLRIEVVGETDEEAFDLIAPANALRIRLVWTAQGYLTVSGSPGAADPGAQIDIMMPSSRKHHQTQADELGGFSLNVIAQSGEALRIRQGITDEQGTVWSAPVRKRAPASGMAYPADQLRLSWADDSLTVTGLGGTAEDATGVWIGLMGLGETLLPSVESATELLDETGGFSASVAGAQAGDRLVVRQTFGSQKSEPVVLTVPAADAALSAGDLRLGVAACPCGDPNWKLVQLEPGSVTADSSVRILAGTPGSEGAFDQVAGSAGPERSTASGWSLNSGSDGGSGQRLIQIKPGMTLQIAVGDAAPTQTAPRGLDPETIAVLAPNEAGDVVLVGATGAAPSGSVIEGEVDGGLSVRRETAQDGSFSLIVPGQTGQSISLVIDMPSCGCQSAVLVLEIPGQGDRSATLTAINQQVLQTWRLPNAVHVGGGAGAAEPGATILAMVGTTAARTLADPTGAFELRLLGQPGDEIALRAQRGSARSDSVSVCAPQVASPNGLAMTRCGSRFQLSGRPGTGVPGETITWTRLDVAPQTTLQQIIGANRAGYVAFWRIPQEARVALTNSRGDVLAANHSAPASDTPLTVIGPFDGQYMLYAAPGAMAQVNTLLLWKGLGAQQRFVAEARRGTNGAVEHRLDAVGEWLNAYEVSSVSHFPYLLSTQTSPAEVLPRSGWSTRREGGNMVLTYQGTALDPSDRLVLFDAESLQELTAAQPAPTVGEEVPEGQVDVELSASLEVGDTAWFVRFSEAGISVPYRLHAPDGDPIDEAVDLTGDRLSDTLRDTDNDGVPDLADTDSDNDGISDANEAGDDPAAPRDTDEDGTPDYRDSDSDGDGLADAYEVGDNPGQPRDTDGDSIADYLDEDSDGNGINDAIERGEGEIPPDLDGDGVADVLDTDDDNDGVSDSVEIGEDPNSPLTSVEGAAQDYQNPCYPRAPLAHSLRPVSQSDLVVALPDWVVANESGPLTSDLPPVGDGCDRPDLEAELVRRPAGLRYRNAEATIVGATLVRHLPAELDELAPWQRPIAFLDSALGRAQSDGLTMQGPGATRLEIGGHPAATASVQLTIASMASEAVLEALAGHLLADCQTDENDQVTCPQRIILARDPAGAEGTNFELTITARARCAGKLDLQIGLSKLEGDAGALALATAHSRVLGQGSIWAQTGASLEAVCLDRTYGAAGSAVDFIFVVDGSGSMAEEQTALGRAVSHLQTAMGQAGVNWRAAVTTMDASPEVDGGDGQLLGGGFTSDVTTLQNLVTSVGIAGDGREYGMRALRRSLQRATAGERNGSAYRLRPEVPVAFIVLTDTEDQSVRQQGCNEADANRDGRSDDVECVHQAIEPTLTLLRGELGELEAPQGQDQLARVYAITSHPNDQCFEAESYGWGWRAVAAASGGSVGNICGVDLDYTELLRRMGEQAINILPELGDGRELIESSIQITTGAEDARSARDASLWRMNAATHRLRLLDAARPSPGEQLGYSGWVWTR